MVKRRCVSVARGRARSCDQRDDFGRDGLKQVEKAIQIMLSVVQTIDMNPGRQLRLIKDLSAANDRHKARLKEIDAQLAALAAPHLSAIPGSMESPYEAAERITKDRERHSWFMDRPPFRLVDAGLSEAGVEALLAARTAVKADLKYLVEDLPSPVNLPDTETVSGWHQDLVAAHHLSVDNAALGPQTRRVIATVGLDSAATLGERLTRLAERFEKVQKYPWAWELCNGIMSRTPAAARLQSITAAFVRDAAVIVNERVIFLSKPVDVPVELPPDKALAAILPVLIAGKNPFGLLSIGNRSYQPAFDAIRVAALRPTSPADWQHVRDFIAFRARVTSLSARWIALRDELAADEQFTFSVSSFSPLAALTDLLTETVTTIPSSFDELLKDLSIALASRGEASAVLQNAVAMTAFAAALGRHVSSARLGAVSANVAATIAQFGASTCDLGEFAKKFLSEMVGDTKVETERVASIWQSLLVKIAYLRSLQPQFKLIEATAAAIAKAGAPLWAERLKSEVVTENRDPAAPPDWAAAWEWARQFRYLTQIGGTGDLARLHDERIRTEAALREGFASLVKERTFYNLASKMKGTAKAALQGFANIIRRLGAGTGQRAVLHRQNARQATEGCYDAVPCWIMPTWRVSEQLPSDLGSFDLVILDEASQSDARELPALLRGKKILVVGDDRQVSPSSAFLSIANIARLRQNFLSEFPFRAEVEPGASIYDLARVMFPAKFVMLREHFRCVEAIIRFSMQFYNQDLIPLRIPKPAERLDPPLIDIYVEDGERRGKSKINPPEAEIIVREIEKIVEAGAPVTESDAPPAARSIGVISLIGADQAHYIQKMLMERVGEAAMVRHRIICGDSASLQGDERDIVFVSMIADSARKQSQTSLQYQQRFNVGLSRAKDRMVLVRSVTEEQLNPNDLKSKVIAHFREPMPKKSGKGSALIDLCESGFERAVFTALVGRGYQVTPQVGSEGFSIDMVVEGEGGRRLAIECDGDQYHGPSRWADDMRRQRILERVGWSFWRCFGSNYSIDPEGMLNDLIETLARMKIMPLEREAIGRGFTEHRTVRATPAAPAATEGSADGVVLAFPEELLSKDADHKLADGDRVVIRYLDEPQSRPLSFTISQSHDDPINGSLLLSSPLGMALADAAPGDELVCREQDRDRPILFASFEKAAAQAA
jgi:very-short-patch-repair endonuclease